MNVNAMIHHLTSASGDVERSGAPQPQRVSQLGERNKVEAAPTIGIDEQ